jgi:radical SAM-linked protein
MKRYRIHYKKTSALRYTGNLDMQKVWERTIRRGKLPVTYTQGFHPQPRLNQACPLPLGMTSRDEILDIWLDQDLEPAEVFSKMAKAAPPGVELDRVEEIELSLPSIQTRIRSSEYMAQLLSPFETTDLEPVVQQLLSAGTLPRIRRNKPYDLRPLVEELEFLSSEGGNSIRMLLAAREGATGRPEEVLEQLGVDPVCARVERTKLVL